MKQRLILLLPTRHNNDCALGSRNIAIAHHVQEVDNLSVYDFVMQNRWTLKNKKEMNTTSNALLEMYCSKWYGMLMEEPPPPFFSLLAASLSLSVFHLVL